MIGVSELMTDPEFCQTFQIKRKVGAFAPASEGEWKTTETLLNRVGIIQPAKTADALKMLPEGERSDTVIAIYSDQDILMANGAGGQSDVVIWESRSYRVAFSKPWYQHGFWFALAVGFIDG